MIVAFTGYRPEKMPFSEAANDEKYNLFRTAQLRVINRLIERGATHFISGVAMGFDTWVAEDIINIKKQHDDISLECAIPFPGQADKWSFKDKRRRTQILRHADSEITLREHYTDDCFFARNRYMVDKADVVVCAYDGKRGGTAYTVDYAKKQNKIVIQINPGTGRVTIISEKNFDG